MVNKRKRTFTMMEKIAACNSGEVAVDAVQEVVRRSAGEISRVQEGKESNCKDQTTELIEALRIDGFEILSGKLVATGEKVIAFPQQKSKLEALLDDTGFGETKNHLDQAVANYTDAHWEAANGQLRCLIDSVFNHIFWRLSPDDNNKRDGEARKRLQALGFISGEEGSFIKAFHDLLQQGGGHAGTSNQGDSLMRLTVGVSIALRFLERAHEVNFDLSKSG